MKKKTQRPEPAMDAFVRYTRDELFSLFENADRKKLEQAFVKGDMKSVCKVLRITEDQLAGRLQKGNRLAVSWLRELMGTRKRPR